MKNIKTETEPTFHGLNEDKIIFIIKVTIICFLLTLSASGFLAQNSSEKIKPLFSSGVFSTGNGHGTFYSVNMGISKGRNAFIVGPVIQQCSMKTRGAKVAYSRVLTVDTNYKNETGMKDLLQLNFFSSIQYTNKLPLSRSVLRDENLIWGDSKQDLNKIRLSTGELVVGFEFYVNITNQISWKNYAGASVYYHFNYSETLDHQRMAPTLSLGTGICFFIQ
ncbi:MAG: hypothetical protein JNJ41_17970 [Bacteroidia bacterium]|nr:hypothetical protein [Bacteroidia bacterium]